MEEIYSMLILWEIESELASERERERVEKVFTNHPHLFKKPKPKSSI